MKLGQDWRVPISRCTNCGKPCDAATATSVGVDAAPRPGDLTICLDCGHLMVFGDDLKLRDLTPEEILEVAGDVRVLAVQRARGKVK